MKRARPPAFCARCEITQVTHHGDYCPICLDFVQKHVEGTKSALARVRLLQRQAVDGQSAAEFENRFVRSQMDLPFAVDVTDWLLRDDPLKPRPTRMRLPDSALDAILANGKRRVGPKDDRPTNGARKASRRV